MNVITRKYGEVIFFKQYMILITYLPIKYLKLTTHVLLPFAIKHKLSKDIVNTCSTGSYSVFIDNFKLIEMLIFLNINFIYMVVIFFPTSYINMWQNLHV